MKEEIIIRDYFKDLGHTKVTVNNWQGKRIYVNLPKGITFSYDLRNDYKISSKEWLGKELYKDAIKAVYRVKEVKRSQKKT